MKRKWTPWSLFCCSGIPWFFISLSGLYYSKVRYYAVYLHRTFRIRKIEDISEMLLSAGLVFDFLKKHIFCER